MASLHEYTWRKAGIFEAVMNSRYKIERSNDLVFGVAEKWCDETKSFIFPWGEATISLEDVMILGGYSVLGSPVFAPVETEETWEELNNARKQLNKIPSKKASYNSWLRKFMDTGSEIEHEAFLALWLSRFVLPSSSEVIVNSVFPVAIHLARGTRVALGPAVLASIYRDLSCLKQTIVASTRLDSFCDDKIVAVELFSPLPLVQVWIWERFSDLRPRPNSTKSCEPRFALWHDLKCNEQDVRSVLDSAKGRFKWRPYINDAKFYGDTEMWVQVDSSLDDELLSFARCIRPSELVGLDCIEQYLPHRVALQFGMDQDVPGSVSRSNSSPEIAWSDYINCAGGGKLYIPFKLFEADVTAGYWTWWKQSNEESKYAFTSCKMDPQSSKRSNEDDTYSGFKTIPKNLNRSHRIRKRKEKGDNGSSDHGSPFKRLKRLAQHPKQKKEVCNASFVAQNSSTPRESPRKFSKGPGFRSAVNIGSNSSCSLSKPFNELELDFVLQKELNNSPFPPGFTPKSCITEDEVGGNHSASYPGSVCLDSDEHEDQMTITQLSLKSNNKFCNTNSKDGFESSSGRCKSLQKELNNSPFPPGFTPKSCITEDEVGGNHSASNPESVCLDSDEHEDQMTITQLLLKSNSKFCNTNSKDGFENSSGRGKSFSCSVADNGVPRGELITKPGAEKAANGGSSSTTVAAIDRNGERPTIEKLGDELEARISRLERLFADKKAAREVKSGTKTLVINLD